MLNHVPRIHISHPEHVDSQVKVTDQAAGGFQQPEEGEAEMPLKEH